MSIFRGYTGAKTCTGKVLPGATGSMAYFLAKYKSFGAQNSGIYNCRPIRGTNQTTSLHGESRAVDFGLKYATDIPTYQKFAEQLRLHSKELGIQCIIFNRRIFSGGYSDKGWHKYNGVNPHTDHLHVELSWAAARRSYEDTIELWDTVLGGKVGKPVVPKPSNRPAEEVWQNSKNSKKDNASIARTLNVLGYNAGVPDGFPGAYLLSGVKSYQKAQVYFPNMKRDGNWGPMTQAHFEWVKDVLQPALNDWAASQRLGILIEDGDCARLTGKHVEAVQRANPDMYKKAGGRVFDQIPGPIFCKMLGIKPHPSA